MPLTSKLVLPTLAGLLAGSAKLAQPLQPLPSAVEPLPIHGGILPFNGAAHQVEHIHLPSYDYTEEEFLVSGGAQVARISARGRSVRSSGQWAPWCPWLPKLTARQHEPLDALIVANPSLPRRPTWPNLRQATTAASSANPFQPEPPPVAFLDASGPGGA